MAEKTCEICCEKFNKSNHKASKCQYCNHEVCMDCNAKYLMGTTKDPHCMNCNKAWNFEVLSNIFTKKFLTGDYKKQRESILYDREKSLLPATQEYAEIMKKRKDINDELVKVNKEYKKLLANKHKVISRNNENYYRASFDVRIKHLENVMKYDNTLCSLKNKKIFLTNIKYMYQYHETHQNNQTERRKFIKACPKNGCNGFLSTAWKCGLCNTKVCSKCHEIKADDEDENDDEDETEEISDNESENKSDESDSDESENNTDEKTTTKHVCKPENIETAKLIKSECKACPSCASMIYKVNGCDQMWCTSCNTAFSWNTGRIETQNIHNPHYYEYLRRTNNGIAPRNPGDIPCGGELTEHQLNSYINAISQDFKTRNQFGFKDVNELNSITSKLYNIQRLKLHMRIVELPSFTTDLVNDNRDLRAKFLINEITEDQFKKILQMNEKARNKKNDIRMVIDMFIATTVDIQHGLILLHKKNDIFMKIKEMETLINYYNDSMKPISKRYDNCVVPFINDKMICIHTKI